MTVDLRTLTIPLAFIATVVPPPVWTPKLAAKNFLSSLESALTSIEFDFIIFELSIFAFILLLSTSITEPIPTPKLLSAVDTSTLPVKSLPFISDFASTFISPEDDIFVLSFNWDVTVFSIKSIPKAPSIVNEDWAPVVTAPATAIELISCTKSELTVTFFKLTKLWELVISETTVCFNKFRLPATPAPKANVEFEPFAKPKSPPTFQAVVSAFESNLTSISPVLFSAFLTVVLFIIDFVSSFNTFVLNEPPTATFEPDSSLLAIPTPTAASIIVWSLSAVIFNVFALFEVNEIVEPSIFEIAPPLSE